MSAQKRAAADANDANVKVAGFIWEYLYNIYINVKIFNLRPWHCPCPGIGSQSEDTAGAAKTRFKQ
jgi:hypothetical protein